MTNIQVVEALKLLNKPYLKIQPIMKQGQYSRTLSDIKNGISKPITVTKFFAKFDYVGDWNNFEKGEV